MISWFNTVKRAVVLTIWKFSFILRRLGLIFRDQITCKYPDLLTIRVCVVEREVKETFDDLDVAWYLIKVKSI
jgi:hypothetical protein